MSQKCLKKIKYENWELLFCSVIWLVKKDENKNKTKQKQLRNTRKQNKTKRNERCAMCDNNTAAGQNI